MMKNVVLIILALLGMIITTTAQNVPSYVPINGLVGWWPFHGNAIDESGNGNNGIVNGNVLLTADRDGNLNSAYNWPNTNSGYNSTSFISLPNLSSLFSNGEISIALWVMKYPNPINVDPRILGVGESGLIFDLNSSSIKVYMGIGLASTNPIGENQWVHIAFISKGNSGESYFYLNGNLIHQVNTSPNLNIVSNTNAPWELGRKSTSAFNGFGGKLDDIGIWNRALTPQEVETLYNGCNIEITDQPADQIVIINSNAEFTLTSSEPNATFQWQTDLGTGFQNMTNAGQYTGVTTNMLTISNTTMSNNNQHFRCIVSYGSCMVTSDVAMLTVDDDLGISENNRELITIYPNPTQNIINIKADSTLFGLTYSIYDSLGRVVLSGELKSENTTVELGNLLKGIYLFSVVGQSMKQTIKIVKSES